MTPEQRQQVETQIQNDFSELQKKLEELQNEVKKESDENKKQEKQAEYQKLLEELKLIEQDMKNIKSRNEEEVLALKTRLESTKKAYQEYRWEVADLQNEKAPTPTTYELLKGSETYNRLLNIISSNPDSFKKLNKDDEGNELDIPEKKLEYIFKKIRKSLTLFLKNKLWDSEKYDKVIDNTIAPAFEWNLMELLRNQWNEANVNMLKGMDKISFDNFNKLVKWVSKFAEKASGSYNKFSQWINAVDYLSVHNWVLREPNKSEILSNPLKFKEYMNDSRFAVEGFSPYAAISDNIFKTDKNQTFEFGMSLQEKQSILSQIWNIQVVNNPKTTALIAGMLDKPEKFLQKTEWLQKTANSLLDWVNSLNSVTKIFWVDILWEITKTPEKRGFLYKIIDFVCKLIWITWWLEWIVKKWRLDRINLTDEKNENISQIFKKYKELAWENVNLNITNESSWKAALNDFAVTDPEKSSTTKWDFLRDSIIKNMDISLVSPAVVQQILWDSYLKKETTEKWETKILINEPEKVTDADKLKLAQGHLTLMKSHLENYKDSDLSDFYTNIHSTEDLALCITASLYADKDDVIEWVKAKVFLPENYWAVRSDWTVSDNRETGQSSWEVSKYKLSEWEYPFKDVPPYKGIRSYDLRNVKITPVLDYSELTKKHEGTVTLSWSNVTNKWYEYPSNNTTWNKNNNPCDISHSGSDIWYVSSGKVADWQALAKYDTPVNGIASAMRLLKNKYHNKSITEIDVGWYQWYFKANEEIWLSALRIKWITDQCNALWVWPHQMLDFNDPTTLKSFVAQVAVLETGTHIGQKLLDDAYNKAFA